MVSSYTQNNGIEKPGIGEQSNTWGVTANNNYDILDRASNGVGTLVLSGGSSNLSTSDGVLSDGQYKVLLLTGTPGTTHTITILPNDAKKMWVAYNLTNQSVIFTQGSGGNVTILAGDSAIIYCTGIGPASAVVSVADHLAMSSPRITGGSISGLSAPLAVADGGTGGATQANARTGLGLGTMATLNTGTAGTEFRTNTQNASTFQPLDTGLTSIAALTTAADRMIYTTANDVYAVTTLSSFARTLIDDADAAAMRTTLGSVIGTNVQAYNANLQSLAGLTLVQGDILYATGANTLVRLPKGVAFQRIRMNSGATAPEWDGPEYYFRLGTSAAGANSTAVQDIFPVDLTLEINTTYEYELFFALQKTAGTTSHTIDIGFGGTAVLETAMRQAICQNVSGVLGTNTNHILNYSLALVTTISAVTSATLNYRHMERGNFRVTTGGTFIPQYQLSAAPGGAYSVVRGSFLRVRKIGVPATGDNIQEGPWA